jgi:hypothetical protein
MKKGADIEAEGGELILKNAAGDHVIIPKKYRLEVQDMIKEKCYTCIDAMVERLPIMTDYAENGLLQPSFTKPDFLNQGPENLDEGYDNITQYYNKDTDSNKGAVTSIQRMLVKKKLLNPMFMNGKFGDETKAGYEQYIRDKATTPKVVDLKSYLDPEPDTDVPKRTPYPFMPKKQKTIDKKPDLAKHHSFNSEEDYTSYAMGEEKYVAESDATNKAPQLMPEEGMTSEIEKDITPRKKGKYSSVIDSYEEKKIKSIKEKSSGEINKYFNDFTGKSKAEVTKIQKGLMKKGYKLPKYGADGKFGEETLAAYTAEMDKNLGEYEHKDLSGELKKKNCDSEWGCAAYVSHTTDLAVLGDAWTMLGNIKKQGKKVKYNIYDDAKFKGVNESNLIQTTRNVKKTNHATKDMFQMGDAVGLFIAGSKNNWEGMKVGSKTHNSHVGVVTGFKEDGTPIISHNIHGKLHHDAYDKLSIAWIAESGAKKGVV